MPFEIILPVFAFPRWLILASWVYVLPGRAMLLSKMAVTEVYLQASKLASQCHLYGPKPEKLAPEVVRPSFIHICKYI
jgi:hypothetical protein